MIIFNYYIIAGRQKMRILKLNIFLLIVLLSTSVYCQKKLLQSGPMVGYSTMREVMLWVQTNSEAKVYFNYWRKGNSEEKYSTNIIDTKKGNAFTAHLIADELEPGNTYEYELLINNKIVSFEYPLQFKTQQLWQWRNDPPDVKFAFGSCLYINEAEYDRPGTPYGGDYEILNHIYKSKPEFMLWMGDNVYLREADWSAGTSILKRYTHTRSASLLQPLLGSVHQYATWDDHDYGPNNSDRSFWNKENTREAFKLFWANPSYGIDGSNGITSFFQWADLDFFLLDDRSFRTPENRKNIEKEIIGNDQIEWLIDALSSSSASFKFVVIGTQFLNPNPGGENHSTCPEERKKILDRIKSENINGVIFLTGDVHRAEITKIERNGTYPLYDFTLSPITAGPSSKAYKNEGRIEESLLMERNFGTIEVTGPLKNRELRLTILNKDGKEHYKLVINANELK
jgi:alkaline phosphatase D